MPKAQNHALLTTALAIAAIAAITCLALLHGISEACVNLGVAAIAGLAGYTANSIVKRQ